MANANHTYSLWAPVWEMASKCEIGVRILLDNIVNDTLLRDVHLARPPGFHDYTICTPSEPNCLYITKPGVTLD